MSKYSNHNLKKNAVWNLQFTGLFVRTDKMLRFLRIYFLSVLCLVACDVALAIPHNPNSDLFEARGYFLEKQLNVLMMVMSNHLGGLKESDLQRIIEYFAGIKPVEEVNQGVVLALGRLLGIKPNPGQEDIRVKTLTMMLEHLIKNGNAIHVALFRSKVAVHKGYTFNNEIFSPLIVQAEEVMASRITNLERVSLYKRGMERWEYDTMLSNAKTVLATYGDSPSGEVVPFCGKKLESEK